MQEVLTKADAIRRGLPTYFTGQPCARGHLCARRAPGGHCLDCVALSRRRVFDRLGKEAYDERQRGYDRAFKSRYPDRKLQTSLSAAQRMRQRDPDRVRAVQRAWRAANSDKVCATRRRHYLAYRDMPQHKLAVAASQAKFRLRVNGFDTPDGLTAVVRRVWLRSEGKCAVCASTNRLELDHILALANGGDNSEKNFQFLCQPCNRSKGVKDFQTWLQGHSTPEGVAA